MSSSRVGRTRSTLVAALALGLTVGGCGRTAPPPAPPDWPIPTVVDDSPEGAARTLLSTLRAVLAAVARNDAAAQKVAEDQAVSLAAADVILSRQPRGAPADAQVRTLVGLWGALIAHYAADFQLDSPRVVRVSPATVLVEFAVARRATVLRAECVQVGNTWRIAALEYAGAKATSRPVASGPA